MSRKKRALFAAIIILFSLSATLAASELILRYRRHHIETSDHLDHGLTLYDRQLGWRLAPNWKGRHKHYDFDVNYSTNRYGFRGDFKAEGKRAGQSYAFVGDSFTFSFGVNDDETFVSLLDLQTEADTYLNFGVPGYSTDQEYLLIQERVFYFSPDVILLVVYLGNDLFDNELPFPLQANHAKPYFELYNRSAIIDGLRLRNSPVPLKTKSREQKRIDLMNAVLGDDFRPGGLIARHLSRFECFRLIGLNLDNAPDLSNRFDRRFEHALRLFTAIIDRTREACIKKRSG